MKSRFGYQHEKMTVARRCLLLPHPSGESESIVHAFGECAHALHHLPRAEVDDDRARALIEEIERSMNTDGLVDETGRGLWYVRAGAMTDEEKASFSDAVDELSMYFARESWGGG